MLYIHIAYATPEKQIVVPCHVPPGTTVHTAITQSSIFQHLSTPHIEHCPVGIFGKIVPLSQVLSDQDRIEIYRPLQVDPKQARRAREKKRKKEAAQKTS